MYAHIQYDAGYTITEVFNDMVSVFTGETVVANLSGATINAGASSIDTSSTLAGWAVHDTIVAGSDVVLKAPLEDDATKFKYVIWKYTNGSIALHRGDDLWHN